MNANVTEIINPEDVNDKKRFTFDHSYWSHDGFVVDKNGFCVPDGASSRYVSQEKIFSDLGTGILKNASDGYNCSLFAYGQTGSGKSYSVVGYGKNKGIVPITCEHLFNNINKNTDPHTEFQVTISMIEIYNEKVRDLLCLESKSSAGLPVRQTAGEGFFVQGLKIVPVGSYSDIEERMKQGTANRTIAATNMNATSSRAHTLVCISFDQITSVNGATKRLSSAINFVDLAGSERADSTGATGDRLKEGANINRSLSVLANVISALAEKKKVVPYRDSVLTKLLQNALGGNSKTVMIAALSPADINYAETLSTLRYADRAKQIKTNAVVNDKLQDSVIKELVAENERLKKQLEEMVKASEVASAPGMSSKERARIQEEIRMEIMAQLENNRERLENQDRNVFKKKLEEARKEVTVVKMPFEARQNMKTRAHSPFLSNLNEDPLLSGVIIHYLDADKIVVSREDSLESRRLRKKAVNQDGKTTAYIWLKGLNIQDTHATFKRLMDGRMEVSAGPNSIRNTKVNGTILTTARILKPMDRILFGSYHLYVYHNDAENCEDAPDNVDWDFAQKELAKSEGIDQLNKAMDENDRCVLQQQLIELLPMLQEVNAIAQEMDKCRTFDIVLLPALLQQTVYGQHKTARITIRMKCSKTGRTWMWDRGKFLNRRFLIQEMYQAFDANEGEHKPVRQEEDPFWEPLEPLLVGFTPVFLQSLAYGLDYTDCLQISDLDGQAIGEVSVSLQPCLQSGGVPASDSPESLFVDNPQKLLGRPFYFKVGITEISLPGLLKEKRTSLRYRVYREERETTVRLDASERTNDVGTLTLKHSRQITFKKVSTEQLTYLEKGCIAFLIFVDQEGREMSNAQLKVTNAGDATSPIRRGSIAVFQSADGRFRNSLRRILQEKGVATADNCSDQLKYTRSSRVSHHSGISTGCKISFCMGTGFGNGERADHLACP
ncbi:unnamed protein product [Taenia asiatica]|uniref:Kinesin motor domain-containing protein n=1 Tax=Taenia asiatica TaxID=60517 RepID=A0A0R3W717_TAEAS|nr:unnamed protein product [Taenia asiatica]